MKHWPSFTSLHSLFYCNQLSYQFLTADDAEELRLEKKSRPLDDCELGQMEEKISEVRSTMRSLTPKQVVTSTSLSREFAYCRERWPRLRATMCFEAAGGDVSLIPRAMQLEEDLVALQDEVKSIVAAYGMVMAGARPDSSPPAALPAASWHPLG